MIKNEAGRLQRRSRSASEVWPERPATKSQERGIR